ncbi:MAG: hypothetical protein Q7R95_11715 [bacterium]|nr:hypothetical protein [bacterium]
MENPKFVTRAYNNFSFGNSPNIAIKESPNSKLSDEIDYYWNLPCQIRAFFPQLLDSVGDNGKNKLIMELYAYPNFFDIVKHNLFNLSQLDKFCKNLNKILSIFAQYRQPYSPKDKRAMYFDKTEKYYEDLVTNFSFFQEISSFNEITINNKIYKNLEQIWDSLIGRFELILLDDSDFTLIHGDLCFSNILSAFHPVQDYCVIKFIDPRGSFGGSLSCYGDPAYDGAKLMHSYEGRYEWIINDMFFVKQNADNNLTFEYKEINSWADKLACFRANFPYNIKYKVIMGLIFIGMCSRHFDSLERQKVMYLTGIKILNECLEE